MNMEEFYSQYLLGAPWIQLMFGLGFSFIVIKFSHILLRRRELSIILVKKHALLKNVRESVLECLPHDAKLALLCDLSTRELGQKLRAGEISPKEILSACQRRTADLLPQNCVAEVILEASAIAEKMSNVQPTDSPLFGIPVSIKEHISVAGYDGPNGLVKMLNLKASCDAVLVKVLRSAGAIPFVTTAMPPAGLSQDSSNAIYGEQCNPLDSTRLAGGSSGGEALLLFGGGSPLGFGSDIGGSLRIPACFCGISSLKPTYQRLSQIGLKCDYRIDTVHIHACLGPIAKYVDSLIDAMRCLLVPEMFSLDLSIPPMPFNEEVFKGVQKKALTIGYYTELGGTLVPPPAPAVARAVLETKVMLEKAGHHLVEFTPPNPDLASSYFFKSVLADGGKGLADCLSYEPLPKSLQFLYLSCYIPSVVKRIFGKFMCAIGNKPLGSLIVASAGCSSNIDVFELSSAIHDYEMEFAMAMQLANVDALICPVCAFPAPIKDTLSVVIDAAVVYTAIYNVLDYPAGVVPVSKVTKQDVEAARRMEVNAKEVVSRAIAKMQRGSEGLPLTVQVVAPPFREETVLRIMKEIETAANFWVR